MNGVGCWAAGCPQPVPEAHEPCCSSHGKPLCCQHYKRFHFVETGPAVCHPVDLIDHLAIAIDSAKAARKATR